MSFRIPILSVALTIVATAPIWLVGYIVRPNLWETDDGSPHLFRTLVMLEAQSRYLGFPRWVPDFFLGYGYPVFNYYASMTYSVVSLMARVGVPIYSGFEALGAVSVVFGAIGVSACVRAFWPVSSGRLGSIAGVAGGLTYVAAPYPFVTNLYVRGDLPEAICLALLPWFILSVHGAFHDWTSSPRKIGLITGTIGALLLLTHSLSAVMAAGCVIIWSICQVAFARQRSVKALGRLAWGGALALGLTAFAAGPMLLERDAVQVDVIKFPIEGILQTLSAPFGVGSPISRPSRSPYGEELSAVDWQFAFRYPWGPPGWDGPVKPGAVQIAILAMASLGVVAWRVGRFRASLSGRSPAELVLPPVSQSELGALTGSFGLVAIAWFLNTNWSTTVWLSIDALRWLQFPSRLYGPFSMGVGLIVGCAVSRAPTQLILSAVGIVIAGCSLIASTLYGAPFPYPGATSQPVSRSSLVDAEYARDTWAGRVTSSGEFTPRLFDVAAKQRDDDTRLGLIGRPRGNHVLDWQYPPASWIGGTVLVYQGEARIRSLRSRGLINEVQVDVETGGATIAWHQLDFPGWRALVDGVPVPIRTPAYRADEDATLGFQLVDVPQGSHTVTAVFGSTPVRIFGDAISFGTAVVLACALALQSRRTKARSLSLLSALGASVVIAILTGGQLSSEVAGQLTRRLVGDAPNRIIMDIAEAVTSGQARLSSPTGTRLASDAFLDVGVTQIGLSDMVGDAIDPHAHGGRRRRWVFMHPPSRATVTFAVQHTGTVFQSGVGMRSDAWKTDYGDGMVFTVEISPAVGDRSKQAVQRCSLRINPRALEDERRWIEFRVPLDRWVGQTVDLTLLTGPVEDVRNDWGGWGNPMVVVDTSIRRPANGPRPPASVVPNPDTGCAPESG